MASAMPRDSARYSGFAVALAWPKALAKEAGDGYDRLMHGLGFNDGGFYRVGHAAVVLVDASGRCLYYDFGRYHAPVGMGRVRCATTDHDLTLATVAQKEGTTIANFDALLCEVQSMVATHGSGPMYASYVQVNFDSAYHEAERLRLEGFLPYGPFEKDGSNCSRFVRSVIVAGEPNWAHALRLEVVPMITPSTLFPVSALYHWTKVPGCLDADAEQRADALRNVPDTIFRKVLPAPEIPTTLPPTSQWLAGESAGSWFVIKHVGGHLLVSRYSAAGVLECTGSYPLGFLAPNLEPRITYPSDCSRVTLMVNEANITLESYDQR